MLHTAGGYMAKSARPSTLASFRSTAILITMVLLLAASAIAQMEYDQRILTGDSPGEGFHTDPHLVNAWGIAALPTSLSGGPFWVSDNGTGLATFYGPDGTPGGLVVTIPPANGGGQGSPTGIVQNISSSFKITKGSHTAPALLLFATLDGTISGWNPSVDSSNAIIAVTKPGAVYTGLAIAVTGSGNFIYAADSMNNAVDLYDANFHLVKSFTDSTLPAGYTPYGIQVLGSKLYVTFSKFGSSGGYVDTYDLSGGSQTHFVGAAGFLNEPWSVAKAPGNFGQFGNAILVGNLGSGWINAYNPSTGAFLGYLSHAGSPITTNGLWGLLFALTTSISTPPHLYFTAGPGGYGHGLFGVITVDIDTEPNEPVLPELKSPNPDLQPSTIPSNGDVNPYGVAFTPLTFPGGGKIAPHDVVVSNFNNSNNLQGTGTTIVGIKPNGTVSTFFQGSPRLGLSTALGVLQSGFVVVGNVPTTDGTCGTIQAGSLLVLDKNGNLVNTFSNPTLLDGPWDLTFIDSATTPILFVSNVLTGTVTRLNLQVQGNNLVITRSTQIASHYTHACNAAALVVGPTGLAYNAGTDTLYVASTADNAIYSVSNASTRTSDAGAGSVFYTDNVHLHGPLGLLRAPNGDLLISNGDAINSDPNQPSEIVEIDSNAHFITELSIDTSQGAAFGIALDASTDNIRFAAVEDVLNALDIWNVQ
jgi:uncharacterized protein (TIGR03118 family)